MLIDWEIAKKHFHPIQKIIHVGLHTGEEIPLYKDYTTKFVEADEDLYNSVEMKYDHHQKHYFAALDYNGTVKFNVMPFKAANSVHEPNLNAKRRSDVYVSEVRVVPCKRLETIQEEGYNTLVMDAQSAELKILKGTNLEYIDNILTECHKEPTYHNAPMLQEIVDYLKPHGFELVMEKMTHHLWGEALFVKRK